MPGDRAALLAILPQLIAYAVFVLTIGKPEASQVAKLFYELAIGIGIVFVLFALYLLRFVFTLTSPGPSPYEMQRG